MGMGTIHENLCDSKVFINIFHGLHMGEGEEVNAPIPRSALVIHLYFPPINEPSTRYLIPTPSNSPL